MSYFSKERFSMKQIVIMLSVAMALCAAYASAVSLNTFSPGTTISSSAVNTNFTNLNNALPLMRASTDSVNAGVTLTAAGLTTVNTVSITAPGAGFLIISGTCFVNNNGVAADYVLLPLLDGARIYGFDFQGWVSLGPDGANDKGAMSYTMTIPITSGSHIVTQQVGQYGGGTINFFYNRNNLTVMYVASSQGSVTTVSSLEEPHSYGTSETGD